MVLSIKTTELQNMVGKAIKCVSNNKLIPLTSLMSIKVKDNVLTLTTTNGTNYFYVSYKEKVDCEDFEASVIAETFTKLIQKTTSETVELQLDGNTLKVKGNGSYTIELPLDENGSVIKFPVKISDDFKKVVGTAKLSTIHKIISTNKASLADNMDFPVLTNYYCGSSVITSDRKKICRSDIALFNCEDTINILVTPALMELLDSLTEEDINVTVDANGNYIYSTTNDTIYAPSTEGVETFPVDAINGLVDQSFESKCVVPRDAVMNVLDRLSLFVDKYDKNGIYLTFTQDGIMFSSKKSSGKELIPFSESENFNAYSCCINIEMLKSQVATQDCDTLELYYGSEVAIKLVNKNVTQIVALLQDDRIEG